MMTTSPEIQKIVDAIRTRQRFVLSSHSRPDGDSIGSQLAMAYALKALGKDAVAVNADPAPAPLMAFPGVQDIVIAPAVEGAFDAAIIMECGDLARTGVTGLDRFFVVNIDHHPGNTSYGRINWFDAGAAACGEMVFDLVRALAVPLSLEIATHLYLAILTDTGSFHYSSISPRTFDICRETLEAGVDPVLVARNVYDSNNMGRLKLFGAVLSAMQIDQTGRIAIVYLDHEMARAAGGTYEDTEGLINLPLTVKEIEAVLFFKQDEGEQYRVSMRSKGAIDIGAVAKEFGGGGHKNAAGCTVNGAIDMLQKVFVEKIESAIESQEERQEGGKAERQEGAKAEGQEGRAAERQDVS
jgi:phosphoesterase RecJ-like protein